MFLFYIFILIPIINARHNDVPSYRSSVMEGDKPILRMPGNSDSESETEHEDIPSGRSPNGEDETLVKDVSILIDWLVNNFGYNVAQGRKNNDVSAFPTINIAAPLTEEQSTFPEIPVLENAEVSSLREREETPNSKHKKKKDKLSRTKESTPSEPVWLKDLKEYMKDLTTRLKQQDFSKYTNPIIASVEKKHGVKIDDIDVDQYGEISIRYTELNKEKKKKKSDPKTLRYGEPDSEPTLNNMQLPQL